jgi:uncharacterized protein YbjT (DUF2867 family)
VRAVLAAGGSVRVLLRNGTPNPFGDAVDIVRGDLAHRPRLHLASIAIDKVVLTLPPIADTTMMKRFGRNAIDAAKALGVKLLVLNTSGPVPPIHTANAGPDPMLEIEAYLRASGIAWIIIRPMLAMDDLTVRAPATCENLAAFVVDALKRPDLAGRAFNVGRPDALPGSEIADLLSEAA